jgi:hypothetical protein
MNFDGWQERVHLNRGEQFGIPQKIWYALAHAADAASRYAGIEPIIFEPLEGGRPGGVCTFYSREFEYKVWIHMAAQAGGPIVRCGAGPRSVPIDPSSLGQHLNTSQQE